MVIILAGLRGNAVSPHDGHFGDDMNRRFFTIVTTLLMLVTPLCSLAGGFSNPISWMEMDMPGVTYDPVADKITAELPISIATLGTNTVVSGVPSAPGIGSFDPAQPWNVLNGAAFSRRIGWNDPFYAYTDIPANDPTSIVYTIKSIYGPGAGIWIDCTGKSPELNNYLAVGQWGVNADNTMTVDSGNPTGYPYSGIFGTTYIDFITKSTVVSPTKWQWDGLMDHNVNTVAFSSLVSPSQLFFADYTLYIGDAAGNELRLDSGGVAHVAGSAGFEALPSASTSVTWQWKGPAFVFTSQSGVPTSAVVESDPLKISGMTAGAKPISVAGGEYAISTLTSLTTAPDSWGDWSSAPGTISNNYWVKVRQTASSAPGTMTIATLAIPAIPGTGEFRVTTAGVVNVPVTYPLEVGITGSGSINSSPAGILCDNGVNSVCRKDFAGGTDVRLFATAGGGFTFDHWGGSCTGAGECVAGMTQARMVTATFIIVSPVLLDGVPYGTLSLAYEAALDNGVIMIRPGTLPEGLSARRNITVTLKGGYDPGYGAANVETILLGGVTVNQGTVIIDKVGIR